MHEEIMKAVHKCDIKAIVMRKFLKKNFDLEQRSTTLKNLLIQKTVMLEMFVKSHLCLFLVLILISMFL